MNKKNNMIIIVIIFLTVLVGIATMFYVNLKDSKASEVEATVKMIGDNYIIVEDDDKEEYLIETKEEYQIGDRIDFVIKNIEKDSAPKKGTVIEINTISKDINFYINDDTNHVDNINQEDVEEIPIIKETPTDEEKTATDADIITHFTNLNNKLDTYNQDKNIGETLKQGFITVVDFLFYDGEIKGKTFKELSDSTKIKVIQIAFSIDEKIEKYFPNYKEEISSTSKKAYTNIKAKATELYLDITTKVCQNNTDTCEAAKEGLKDLKANFSLTWNFIKEISGIGLNKLKDWYEVWKNC